MLHLLSPRTPLEKNSGEPRRFQPQALPPNRFAARFQGKLSVLDDSDEDLNG
jgi:hypothetical protein